MTVGSGRDGSCWPTGAQELLLEAALFDGDRALHAWDRWRTSVDLERIDEGSFRLLPLLYSNLVRLSVGSPLLARLKGVHRQSWFRNQLLFRRTADLVQQLEREGIGTLLLKGVALSLAAYQDEAVRPMADGDILVQSKDATRALDTLKAAGWRPQPEPDVWPPRFRPSWPFRSDDGQEIDLHCHVLLDCLHEGADDEFWRDARPASLRGIATRVLSPADQLLHIIVHGLTRNVISPIRWIADAVVVARNFEGEIDWSALAERAHARKLGWTVYTALTYLVESFDLAIPADALRDFAARPPSIGERLEHWSKTEPGAARLAGRLWFGYARASRAAGVTPNPAGFVGYLEDFWHVDGLVPLMTLITSKATRRTLSAVGFSASRQSVADTSR